jgi:hypothetical protein
MRCGAAFSERRDIYHKNQRDNFAARHQANAVLIVNVTP